MICPVWEVFTSLRGRAVSRPSLPIPTVFLQALPSANDAITVPDSTQNSRRLRFEVSSSTDHTDFNTILPNLWAATFAALCRKFEIRLIPEFQSVGHQSWKSETFPLLTVYPKFDLTPGPFPNNEEIYCREWDVSILRSGASFLN